MLEVRPVEGSSPNVDRSRADTSWPHDVLRRDPQDRLDVTVDIETTRHHAAHYGSFADSNTHCFVLPFDFTGEAHID